MNTDNNGIMKTCFRYLTMGLAIGSAGAVPWARRAQYQDDFHADGYPRRSEFPASQNCLKGALTEPHRTYMAHADDMPYPFGNMTLRDTGTFPLHLDTDACSVHHMGITLPKQRLMDAMDKIMADLGSRPYEGQDRGAADSTKQEVQNMKLALENVFLQMKVSKYNQCMLNAYKLYAMKELRLLRGETCGDDA